jgi:putative hydrolase of the HAD superfamily
MIRWIAFDADDTLWENEKYYHEGQELLAKLLAPYQPADVVEMELLKTETSNLSWYGYGIKAFGLSMMETAIRLSNGAIGSSEINALIKHLRQMLEQPADLLPGVVETLEVLKPDYRMMVITKGDILDQERKLANSRLESFFEAYEVVSYKKNDTYEKILKRLAIEPGEFLMVGNSLRSDVLPVVKIGGYGVYIPHRFTWAHEVVADTDSQSEGYVQINSIKELPGILEKLKHQ